MQLSTAQQAEEHRFARSLDSHVLGFCCYPALRANSLSRLMPNETIRSLNSVSMRGFTHWQKTKSRQENTQNEAAKVSAKAEANIETHHTAAASDTSECAKRKRL